MRLVRATPSSRTPGPSRSWTWPLDGPDRRRAVGHGPRAQDGGKGSDLGGPPRVGREKTGALNRILRGRFRPDRHEKRENQRFGGLRAVFIRAGSRGMSRGPFPGKRWRWHRGGLITVGPCDAGTAGAIVELSLFLEGPRHGQPHLQELRPQRRCRRLLQLVHYGHRGQGLQSLLRRPSEETSSRAKDSSTATRARGRQHIRSTAPVPIARD